MKAPAKKQKIQDTKVRRGLVGNNFRLVPRIQPAATAEHA